MKNQTSTVALWASRALVLSVAVLSGPLGCDEGLELDDSITEAEAERGVEPGSLDFEAEDDPVQADDFALECFDPGKPGPGGTCLGGDADGKPCETQAEADDCQREGGMCVQPFWSCEQEGTSCSCDCVNLLNVFHDVCMDNMKTSCGLASNCDAEACDDDGCTWRNATCT